MTRLKGMIHKPGSPASLKEMDEAIASEAARKPGARCPRLSRPSRVLGRRDP